TNRQKNAPARLGRSILFPVSAPELRRQGAAPCLPSFHNGVPEAACRSFPAESDTKRAARPAACSPEPPPRNGLPVPSAFHGMEDVPVLVQHVELQTV